MAHWVLSAIYAIQSRNQHFEYHRFAPPLTAIARFDWFGEMKLTFAYS